jgi:DNA repair exonuclease SbcCD ATPase subunit
MQFAGTIREAATRIDEATAVYRFKARQTAGEYDDLGARWADSRARQFDQQHLQAERETMEEGERLCRQLTDLCEAAKRHADDAESQLSASFALQSEYEASTEQATHLLDESDKLTARVNGDTAPLPEQIRTVDSTVEEASQDPGWKPKAAYEGSAKPASWRQRT